MSANEILRLQKEKSVMLWKIKNKQNPRKARFKALPEIYEEQQASHFHRSTGSLQMYYDRF